MADRSRAKAANAARRKAHQFATRFERARCQDVNTRKRRIGKRGEPNRSVLVDFVESGLRRTYHATKGWRLERVSLPDVRHAGQVA